MPATEPRDYRIALSLKAALQAVSVAAGYYYDVDNAAVKLDAEQGLEEVLNGTGPRPVVLIELRDDAREHEPANYIMYDRHYTVHWIHDPTPLADAVQGEPSPTTDGDRVLMFERGVADVERAVSRDTGRGGLAIDTRVENVRWNKAEEIGRLVWAEVDVTIKAEREYGVTA